MPFNYKSVVPWGRSFNEYVKMFNLTDKELCLRFLGCGDGPASFNCGMSEKGRSVVSIDPIYKLSKEEIKKRIDETYDDVIGQTYKNRDKFIWKEISSVEELGKIRMSAMKDFLDDFEKGKIEKRYISGELPVLPFAGREFDMALSSHFLFLHMEHLSLDFHIQAIREMLRVAKEVRIFPILDVNGIISPYLETIMEAFSNKETNADFEEVPYEFQKGGNKMLKIRVIKGDGMINRPVK